MTRGDLMRQAQCDRAYMARVYRRDVAPRQSGGRGFCVVLGDGRRVTVAQYCAAWRALRSLDISARVSRGLHDADPTTSGAVLREYRAGLHDRINRHWAAWGVGRKWHPDWQRAAAQTAWRVNTPRLVVGWVPMEFRARLAHRLGGEA